MKGTNIGRYHILEQLGEGGMATVYKAFDTRLEREVAVKFLRTERLDSGKATKRFEIEAKALAQVSHPNIVKVLDYGEHEGLSFLVIEYVPGMTLKQGLGTPLPWQEAAQMLAPIARALAHAHKSKIVHRDVKPANILISRDGKPMLSDFGVAKMLALDETVDLTGTSVGVGTPWYMSPEQGRGHPVDFRADIYSLGIVFYELVTGRKPYQGETPMAVIYQHIKGSLPKPTQIVPSLPKFVEVFLLKSLDKEPEKRFQSMDAMADALEAMAAGQKLKIESPRGSAVPLPLIGVLGMLMILAVLGIRSIQHQEQSSIPISPPTASPADDLVASTSTVQPSQIPSPDSVLIDTPQPTATSTIEPTITAMPTLGAGASRTSSLDNMVMLYVPEGEFIMGSESGTSDQSPAHTVYLDAFWIDKTEVTNEMYLRCVHAGYCKDTTDIRLRDPEYEDYPVVWIGWNSAVIYCEWAGKRLPTEAEWEKAARGADGRTFPWGEGIDCQRANYRDCGSSAASLVGSYPSGASLYGVLDMAGNVAEWVSDFYGSSYYAMSPYENPAGPSGGQNLVRGGSWNSDIFDITTSFRLMTSGNPSTNKIGIRCVADDIP